MGDVQGVGGVVEVTSVQEHLGDFFDGDVGIKLFCPGVVGFAGDEQVLVFCHLTMDGVQKGCVDVAGGDEQPGVFAPFGLLPEQGIVRPVREAFVERDGCGEHVGVVGFVDDGFAEGIFIDEGWRQFIEAVAASALPAARFGDAAGVFSSDDFVQADFAVGIGVIAHLDADPSASHLLRHSGGSAGTQEGIEH